MNRLVYFAILVMTTVLSSSLKATEFVRPDTWTIENMSGKAPTYAGPSCYSAALLALGYETIMANVSPTQMRMYVDKYCKERKGPMEVGDLLVLTDAEPKQKPAYMNHVAIYLGNDRVFEKELGEGTSDPDYQKFDPSFASRPMSESFWFKNYSGDGQVLTAFKCKPASVVHSELATCEKRVKDMGMDAIRSDMEKMIWMTAPDFRLEPSTLVALESLIEQLRHLGTSDPCYMYILGTASSIDYSFKDMREKLFLKLPNSKEWLKAKEDLNLLMFQQFEMY